MISSKITVEKEAFMFNKSQCIFFHSPTRNKYKLEIITLKSISSRTPSEITMHQITKHVNELETLRNKKKRDGKYMYVPKNIVVQNIILYKKV